MSRLTEIKAQLEAAYPHEITPASGLELVDALEAVEKLHRKMPIYTTFAGDCEHGEDCNSVEIGGESMCPAETEGYTCDECAELSSEELPDYPCATIRAIAEALQ